jgi:1,2-diacylglycerol 3-alpha-glucosyltransferase/glucuronosyltransferase
VTMRILVATDAWHPQRNGVVRTLTSLADSLRALGAEVEFLTPEGMPTVALPGFSDIRVALADPRRIAARIAAIAPDAIHIATEGPIGLAVRWYCVRHGRPFTTSFHARFADYVAARWRIPEQVSWACLRWFHNAGRGTFAATASLADELAARGLRSVLRWPRGVDARLFRPRRDASLGLLRPVFLTVGRLSLKKNLAAFLALDLPGTKVVVGEGPALTELARRCPQAIFLGAKDDADLARIYAAADVFVFPGRTDTCGLAMLEALACGVPVAGFPVAATRDVIGDAPVAALDEDLRTACLDALALSRDACRAFAETMNWDESARGFLANLERAGVAAPIPQAQHTLIPTQDAARAAPKAVEPAIG